jgi:hypothetical protein
LLKFVSPVLVATIFAHSQKASNYNVSYGPSLDQTDAITTESLETMGAPALASLLVDHAKVDPVLRRKLQLLLASKEGSDKLVAEIEKRIRTIRRSKSHITWERTKEIVQDLDHLRETIAGQLASQDRMAAVERMWDFIGIAEDVLERTGDNYGTVEAIFGQAMVDLGRLCADDPGSDPAELARRVLSIVEGDGFGSSGAIIRQLSEALGSRGRAQSESPKRRRKRTASSFRVASNALAVRRSHRCPAEQTDPLEPPGRRCGCWPTSPIPFSRIAVRGERLVAVAAELRGRLRLHRARQTTALVVGEPHRIAVEANLPLAFSIRLAMAASPWRESSPIEPMVPVFSRKQGDFQEKQGGD